MAIAKRQHILEALLARCQAIKVADGFQTDAGFEVYLHEAPAFGDADPNIAIAIVVGEDETAWHGEKAFVRMPVEFQALAKADLDRPWVALEAVLADLKQALELEDRYLGGLTRELFERGATRSLPREPGTAAVGVGLTYYVPFSEKWGRPDL